MVQWTFKNKKIKLCFYCFGYIVAEKKEFNSITHPTHKKTLILRTKNLIETFSYCKFIRFSWQKKKHTPIVKCTLLHTMTVIMMMEKWDKFIFFVRVPLCHIVLWTLGINSLYYNFIFKSIQLINSAPSIAYLNELKSCSGLCRWITFLLYSSLETSIHLHLFKNSF